MAKWVKKYEETVLDHLNAASVGLRDRPTCYDFRADEASEKARILTSVITSTEKLSQVNVDRTNMDSEQLLLSLQKEAQVRNDTHEMLREASKLRKSLEQKAENMDKANEAREEEELSERQTEHMSKIQASNPCASCPLLSSLIVPLDILVQVLLQKS